MELRLKERLGRKFDEEIRFFKGWIDGPKSVGAILPTSAVTARRMASVINPASGLPVLELGPGTGIITKAILGRGVAPENIVSIEYSTDFYRHLKKTIPGVNFINGDAFDLETTLADWRDRKFDAVVSAIPMLSFPMEKRIALWRTCSTACLPAGPSSRSPTARCRRSTRARIASISGTSTSWSAISRRRSSGSTAGARTPCSAFTSPIPR